VHKTSIRGNSASKGGGIYGVNSARITIDDTTIAMNSALSGAGIFLFCVVLDLIRRLAVFVQYSCTLDVTFAVISNNAATQDGGAIYCAGFE